ncbi:MAG: hypothetical protein methR_P2780 [Methyloprofundus sp.]|nr:MAG: hypothetical protein methR_P2780 [Methyloprofundus sp.]
MCVEKFVQPYIKAFIEPSEEAQTAAEIPNSSALIPPELDNFTNEVTLYGCGSSDVRKRYTCELEQPELQAAAFIVQYELNKDDTNLDLQTFTQQQLSTLAINAQIHQLCAKEEMLAFAIFLHMTKQDDDFSYHSKLASIILQLSTHNFTFENEWSRLWVTLFQIGDDQLELNAWIDHLHNMIEYTNNHGVSTRSAYLALEQLQLENTKERFGETSEEYVSMRHNFNKIKLENCFFPI